MLLAGYSIRITYPEEQLDMVDIWKGGQKQKNISKHEKFMSESAIFRRNATTTQRQTNKIIDDYQINLAKNTSLNIYISIQ